MNVARLVPSLKTVLKWLTLVSALIAAATLSVLKVVEHAEVTVQRAGELCAEGDTAWCIEETLKTDSNGSPEPELPAPSPSEVSEEDDVV